MKNKKLLIIVAAVLCGVLFQAPLSSKAQDQGPKVIAITAKRFEFTPNQVTLKKGETVKLQLTSEDVTHGLYVKPLKIDTDIQPGKTTELTVTPQAAGTFTAICDHFCGVNHGNMKMKFVVEE